MSGHSSTAVREAYERWAPLYDPSAHNPLMRVEERAMLEQWPKVEGKRTLDLACGTGRYARRLEAGNASQVVALDFCEPMLSQVSTANKVRADMMKLPFAGGSFDVIVSGLAVAHATSLKQWMREVSRVLAAGGTLLYSDFHPEAIRAGLTRSFKDRNDLTCTVPHGCYEVALHREEAAAAGLAVEVVTGVRVGFELTEPFPKSERFYRQWHGVPIVLIVRARKSTP